MSKEDAVKTALVLVHGMLDKVQDQGEAVVAYWAQAKELKLDDPSRDVLLVKMTALAEKSLEQVTKAAVLTSALSATQNDLREKNAVLMNALKALSHGYGKLLRMQECLGDISGQ